VYKGGGGTEQMQGGGLASKTSPVEVMGENEPYYGLENRRKEI